MTAQGHIETRLLRDTIGYIAQQLAADVMGAAIWQDGRPVARSVDDPDAADDILTAATLIRRLEAAIGRQDLGHDWLREIVDGRLDLCAPEES